MSKFSKSKLILILNIVLFGMAAFILVGCAAQGSASGGPEDKTGPSLLSMSLSQDTTGIRDLKYIDFQFDELINPTSILNKLLVSPSQQDKPIVKVKKNIVRVILADTLRSNTTYVLNFGRNIMDYRGNPTQDEVRLAFATGDSIDQGKISGHLFNLQPKDKAFVWCWKTDTDTLPKTDPDFIASVSENGNFRISNLAPGKYRLLAVSGDGKQPARLQKGLFGICQTDPVVIENRHAVVHDLRFALNTQNPVPVMISKATGYQQVLNLSFNEDINPLELSNAVFDIENGAARKLAVWQNENVFSEVNILFDSLYQDEEIVINARNIVMANGRKIDFISFDQKIVWKPERDTLNPTFTGIKSSHPSGRYFSDASVIMNFSEPLKTDIHSEIFVYDEDTVVVPFDSQWMDDNSLQISPVTPWLSNHTYSIFAVSGEWQDYSDSTFTDSLLNTKFSIEDKEQFGLISGNVSSDRVPMDEIAIKVILANQPGFYRTVSPDSTGNYKITNLLPGNYSLELWHDANGNMKYDAGWLLPFTESELYNKPDIKISVRARWEQTKVDLSL